MIMANSKIPFGRQLTIWFCSFLLIGTILFYFKGMPLLPILGAGVLTLAITLLRYYFKKGK